MEIEYAYSLTENVFYAGAGMLRFYALLLPGYFIYRFLKVRKSLVNLLMICLTTGTFFHWEYSKLNQRFVKATFTVDRIELKQLNGNMIIVEPKNVERFWSISIGRSGGWSCYLLIKSYPNSYESLIVQKRDYSCKRDAEKLNLFYLKT